jgi:penicillin-binding protein 1A
MIVETTLDLTLQTQAERSVRRILDRDRSKGVQQAALVALDGEGRVRAMIGGASYADSQFNRAVDARRQAGSAFKPFVYLTGLESGYTPETRVNDAPIRIGNWSPRNYSGSFAGEMSFSNAVAQSTNTVAAGMADQIGRDNVARTARRLGITSRIGLEPAMALGAVEVSPLEMAQAFDAFANGGKRVTAYGISRIRSPEGRVIYQRASRANGPIQAISNPYLYYMNQMLRGVMTSGTGRAAAIAGRDIAGKTGTTSDYKDAWFVGYTGGFVTAVWVGKDDNTAMRGVTGGSSPAAIWRGFMEAALPRLNAPDIPNGPAMPEGWQPPASPVENLLGEIGDLFGDSPPPSEAVPPEDQPTVEPRRTEPGPAVVRPTAPQPQAPRDPPNQRPEPAPPPEKRAEPLFF